MHTGPMSDSDGDFGEYKHTDEYCVCRRCRGTNVRYRIWESHCGGYEDYNYKCFDCEYQWWVDGIDS